MNIYVLTSPTGSYGVDVSGVTLIEPDYKTQMYETFHLKAFENISYLIDALETTKISLEKVVNKSLTPEQFCLATPQLLLNTINEALELCRNT